MKSWDAVRFTNVWLALLHYLHDGLHFSLASWQGSAAQQRAQLRLLRRARAFLRRSPDVGTSGDGIRTFLKTTAAGYGSSAVVLPLGIRAGVPVRAAVVDTADVLRIFDAEVALQCEEPSALLFP